MTRYLLANVFGLLLILGAAIGGCFALVDAFGWAGPFFVLCVMAGIYGRRLATLAPPAGPVQGYTYERDAR